MSSMEYKKPELKFVSLRNEEPVANTCWGYHGTDTELFCDTEGKGFVSFKIAQGSCALNLVDVRYYGEDTNQDGSINATDGYVPISAGNPKYEELCKKLEASGGAQGNPYKGEGTIVVPGQPDTDWS